MVDGPRPHRRDLRGVLNARCGSPAAAGRGIQTDCAKDSIAGSAIAAIRARIAPPIAGAFRARPAAAGNLRVVAARIRHATLRERRRAGWSTLLQWPA